MEYAQAIWFTKPNHDRPPVMSLDTGNSLIAAIIFGVGVIPSGVISKLQNSTLPWQN